jgi:NAD+ kinase
VFGGDGSILSAARQMGANQLPVAAVKVGRLGFLADLSPDELPELLDDFAANKLGVLEHLMLICELLEDGEVVGCTTALNEVAIQTGPPFTLIDIELSVDGNLVTEYSCDGLLISTPVGSTGHALSAGGPILRKDLQIVTIVPISPHTLTHRPVVDSADRVFELIMSDRRGKRLTHRQKGSAAIVVDGRTLWTFGPSQRLRIRRADSRFKLITAPTHCYYQTLREKLGWSGHLESLHRKEE